MNMDFNQAMDSMQSMFPHFDYDTIKTVLASNEGHVERTIEDLMKLTEEAENGPDDDNIFADNTQKVRQNSGSYGNNSYGNSYSNNTGTASKSKQEEEDARMAYQLQLKYMEQERAENQAASQAGYTTGSNSQPRYQGEPGPQSRKKPGFYKNLKVGLNKLFQKKKKGATKNPGVYTEIEPSDGDNLHGYAQHNADDDDDSPMPLADALGQHDAGYDQPSHNQGGYKPSNFSQGSNQGNYGQGSYGQSGQNQGGYSQGSYNQGGYNQGGYEQGGYNQGGYNQGGHNQGGFQGESNPQNYFNSNDEDSYGQNYRQNNNTNHNSDKYPGFD